jgi:predicted transcriptional regulator of viral defense system
LDHRIALVASQQDGLITRQQLRTLGLDAGMIGHRLSSGRLCVVHRGVYRVAGAPASFEQQHLAALYAARCGAVSHLAAAVVFELEGIQSACPEITIPHERRVRLAGVVVHRTRDLGPNEVCRVGPLRVTTPARTLVDLSPILTLNDLQKAMDDAIRKKLTTLAELREAISRRAKPGVPTVTPLRFLVRLRDGSLYRPSELR